MPARTLMFQGTGSDVGKSLIVAGLARAYAARPRRPSVQAAEHVEQRGGDGGRRRDRPRPGAAGARGRYAGQRSHEPGSAEAAERDRRADRRAGPRLSAAPRRAAYQADEADLLPYVLDSFARLQARGRSRSRRRRRQRRGSQSAGQRHRQYGICPRRRRAGRADRRHRPRRRHRQPRRHQGRAGARGCRADSRLHRQQIPRRRGAFRRRHGAASRRRPDGRRWAWCRILPMRACCRRRMRSRSNDSRPAKPDARVRIAVPILPHIANFDDLDPLDANPTSRSCACGRARRLPGDADLVVLPGSKATIADLAALRAPAGTSISPRIGAAADVCLAFAAAIRCSGARSPIPRASKARPARSKGSACSMSRPTLSAEKRLEPASGTTSDGAPFAGYEMHMGVTGGGFARPFAAPRGWFAGRRGFSRRPGDRHLYARPVRRRPAARGVARAFRGRGDGVAYDDLVERTLDALAAHLEPHISISIASSA